MWREFAQVLNELNKTYKELVRLGEKKHSALVAIDMAGLERLLQQEEGLTATVRQLEQQRQKYLIDLAVENRELKKDSHMREVVQIAPPPLRPVLQQLHTELDAGAARVRELSEDNEILVQAALRAVHFHMNRLNGTQAGSTYGQGGSESAPNGTSRRFQFDA